MVLNSCTPAALSTKSMCAPKGLPPSRKRRVASMPRGVGAPGRLKRLAETEQQAAESAFSSSERKSLRAAGRTARAKRAVSPLCSITPKKPSHTQ